MGESRARRRAQELEVGPPPQLEEVALERIGVEETLMLSVPSTSTFLDLKRALAARLQCALGKVFLLYKNQEGVPIGWKDRAKLGVVRQAFFVGPPTPTSLPVAASAIPLRTERRLQA